MLRFSTDQLLVILGACSVMMKPSDMVKIARKVGRMTGRAVGRLILAQRQLDEILGQSAATKLRSLDKTIASLETELSAARSLQESLLDGSPVAEEFKVSESIGRRKYLMVIGINTAFSSRKRRDSIRYTWMPQGEKRKKLEEEKGIIIRFFIGHRHDGKLKCTS